MSRLLMDMRETPAELPPLDYILTDTDYAIARFAREAMAAQQIALNERETRTQG